MLCVGSVEAKVQGYWAEAWLPVLFLLFFFTPLLLTSLLTYAILLVVVFAHSDFLRP